MNKKQIKIYVVPKVELHHILELNNITDDNVDEFANTAFICINDSRVNADDSHINYYTDSLFNVDHYNVLNLFFDDVEKEFNIGYRAFTKEDAKRIIKFLNYNNNIDTIFIYCANGISRSGAVGLFALKFLNGDENHFKEKNSNIRPNKLVLEILDKVFNEYKKEKVKI